MEGSRRAAGRWLVIGRPLLVVLLVVLFVMVIGFWVRDPRRPPLGLLAPFVELCACVLMLWRPVHGAALALLPFALTAFGGVWGTEGVIVWFMPGVFAAVGSRRQFIAVEAVVLTLGALVGLRIGDVPYAIVVFLVTSGIGAAVGYAIRLLTRGLRRGDERVAVLSVDPSAIRGAERLRLADELRVLVGEGLAQSRSAVEAAAGLTEVIPLKARLEVIRVSCVDAVTRVRALVGMLREEDVADGGDESLTAPVVSHALDGVAGKLREAGVVVSFRVAPEIDERNLVTQLTLTRVVEQICRAAAELRPEAVAIDIAGHESRSTLIVNVARPGAPPQGDLELLRLTERVEALGGTLRVEHSGDDWVLRLELGNQQPPKPWRTTASAAIAASQSYWRRHLEPILVTAVCLGLFFYSVAFNVRTWQDLWEPVAYLAALVLYVNLPLGLVLSVIAIVALAAADERHLLPVAVLQLVGAWRLVRMRHERTQIIVTVICIAVMLLLSQTLFPAGQSLEMLVSIVVLTVGMLGFSLQRQYLRLSREQRARQEQLLASVQAARVEERNLLARELHDVLAHHISVVLLQCMAYGESDDPAELQLAFSRIDKALEEAVQELALLTSVMADAEVEDSPALVRPVTVSEQLEQNLLDAGFLPVMRVSKEADQLPIMTQRTLTRVMQEGSTNIMRYGQPGAACVFELEVWPSEVVLEVRNRMPQQKRHSELSLGYGLTGIRERVDLSGGAFSVGPRGDEWVIRVELPRSASDAETVGGPSAYTR